MKTLLLFITVLFTKILLAQEAPFFHPDIQNDQYRQLKVRFVIDSFFSSEQVVDSTEYDTLGREIYFHRPGNNLYFTYQQNNDTLCRYSYKGKQRAGLYCYEQCIYSKTNKITRYTKCTGGKAGEPAMAELYIFKYDDNDSLYERTYYTILNYKDTVSENMAVKESELYLAGTVQYKYSIKNNLHFVVAQRVPGASKDFISDTLVHGNNGYTRYARRLRTGFDGKIFTYDQFSLNEVKYKGGVQIITGYEKLCRRADAKGACLASIENLGKTTGSVIFKANGLPSVRHFQSSGGLPATTNHYSYAFY